MTAQMKITASITPLLEIRDTETEFVLHWLCTMAILKGLKKNLGKNHVKNLDYKIPRVKNLLKSLIAAVQVL